MCKKMIIRIAKKEDAKQLLAIYAPYVTNTAITFEYEIPSEEEFRNRIIRTLEKYPYLVLEQEKEILGYAYASAFKGRPAYDWAVETSIYVKEGVHGKGIGKKLYTALEEILKKQHIINMNACIAYPNPESIVFHEKSGYKTVAHFTKCGYKLGKWYDMIWMEKMLGPHPESPQPVLSIRDVME
ncbi:MAG: N-acetyltransferase [Clostridiales bacterium]|nr:N-acetyltransferase [Clostridiales bacterium]